jgi:hypothetical protein
MTTMTERQAPTYNRQRLLLFLLEQTGGQLSKMDFQKLLFLAHQAYSFNYYEFVPYHFGCYSFQAADDLEGLEHKGWIETTDRHISLKDKPYLGPGIKRDERQEMAVLMHRYRSLRGDSLLKEVYTRFPYYAINSRIAERLVTEDTIEEIGKQKALFSQTGTRLFTIGYEGLSLEAYLNRLIQHNVRLLCDVRKNPLSRKFGFSKSTLSAVLPKLGIEYRHIPELGIASEKRRNLETREDYEHLFREYTLQLPQREPHLSRLNDWFGEFERVALTCYEEHPESCHRSRVSGYLSDRWNLKVTHL